MPEFRGHGLDVVDIVAFGTTLEMAQATGMKNYFTEGELRECGEAATKIARLAGRFAVKEAVLKALGVGWGDGVSFTDVETVTLTTGKPTIALHGKAAQVAASLGIRSWFASTSHTAQVAVASVIATD
jgi:holo-[acyl-carrier protein] synthase